MTDTCQAPINSLAALSNASRRRFSLSRRYNTHNEEHEETSNTGSAKQRPVRGSPSIIPGSGKNVDGRVTKNGVLLAIKIAKDCVIQEIEVYSFKSVKPITSLPKPLVLKVWDMLVRSGIVEL